MKEVYLNGSYVPRDQATLDIEDRGAMFADGVYEVVHYFSGRAFAMEEHLKRLERSMAAIDLVEPRARELGVISDQLIKRNSLDDATVYWQVTRGSARRDHVIHAETKPTILAIAYEAAPLDIAAEPISVHATLTKDLRWHQCAIKSLMLLPNVLAKSAAHRAGAFEAILHRQGLVTEGSSTNIFVVCDGELRTHEANEMILGGITRDIVIQLARDSGIACHEQAVTVDQLLAAQEVMLTGTTTLVAAVSRVDDSDIAGGHIGPITTRLHRLLIDHIAKVCGIS
jgi:D-alanine transaminase